MPANIKYSREIYILILGMILTGAADTIVYKFQNTTKYGNKYFFHPYMQAVTMFLGEAMSYLAFLYIIKSNPEAYQQRKDIAERQGLKTKMNPLWLLIPASSDFITSTLQYISLNFINASVYQMLRGLVIVIVAIFSKLFLKREIKNYQILGCALAIIGVSVVGSSSLLFADKKPVDSDQPSQSMVIISYGLILISLISNGTLLISEEKLFSIYYLEPFQVVGWEGFWGLCIYAVLLPILSITKCPISFSKNGACVQDNGINYFERPDVYFQQMGQNGVQAFFIVFGLFSIATYNVFGVTVTKRVSSLARAVVDVSRTLIVWIIGIIVTASGGRQWENLNTAAIILEGVGFTILVTGNLIYNEIIIAPGFKYDKIKDEEDQEDTNEQVDNSSLIKKKNRGSLFKSDASERYRS